MLPLNKEIHIKTILCLFIRNRYDVSDRYFRNQLGISHWTLKKSVEKLVEAGVIKEKANKSGRIIMDYDFVSAKFDLLDLPKADMKDAEEKPPLLTENERSIKNQLYDIYTESDVLFVDWEKQAVKYVPLIYKRTISILKDINKKTEKNYALDEKSVTNLVIAFFKKLVQDEFWKDKDLSVIYKHQVKIFNKLRNEQKKLVSGGGKKSEEYTYSVKG